MRKAFILIMSLILGSFTYGQKEKIELEKQTLLYSVTLYHSNGSVAQQGHITKNNKLQGTWVSYDEQGNKRAIGNYAQGKKVGTWFFYDLNSKFLTQVEFDSSHNIADVHQLEFKYEYAENEIE